jgi:hypothetical protein
MDIVQSNELVLADPEPVIRSIGGQERIRSLSSLILWRGEFILC